MLRAKLDIIFILASEIIEIKHSTTKKKELTLPNAMNNPSGRIKPIQIGFGFLLRARIVHQTRLLRLTHRRSGSPADAPGLIQKQTNGGHKNQKGPVLDQIPHHSANELVLESVAEFLALPANSDAHPAELVGFFIGD